MASMAVLQWRHGFISLPKRRPICLQNYNIIVIMEFQLVWLDLYSQLMYSVCVVDLGVTGCFEGADRSRAVTLCSVFKITDYSR